MHLTNDTIYYRERKNVASRLLPHFNFCIFPLSSGEDRRTPRMKRPASSGSPGEGRAAGGLQGGGRGEARSETPGAKRQSHETHARAGVLPVGNIPRKEQHGASRCARLVARGAEGLRGTSAMSGGLSFRINRQKLSFANLAWFSVLSSAIC